MERTIDDDARMLVEYNTAQYRRLMGMAERAYHDGDMTRHAKYREAALKASRRVDDLRGLTDEGVR